MFIMSKISNNTEKKQNISLILDKESILIFFMVFLQIWSYHVNIILQFKNMT